jgi:hypothetical protein
MNIGEFLFDTIEKAREHNIKIILDPNKVEFTPGYECSGLFDADNSELIVNINKPQNLWLPVFVHEVCHMDQFIEDCEIWKNCYIKNNDVSGILDMWLQHIVDLNQTQLDEVTNKILDLELDCEKRAVEKIKKYKLDININDYIKKANAYVYFYRALAKTRKWTSAEVSPYVLKEVWEKMPIKFLKDQSEYKSNDPLVDLIVSKCFK